MQWVFKNAAGLPWQWLRTWMSTAGGRGSSPGQGTKIPPCHTVWPQKKINTWCWSVKQVKTQGSGTSWWSRVQWLRLCAPSAGGLGSLPCGGTRSHLLQLRVHIPQLKIPRASTKVWQPNKQVNKENLKVQIITSRSFTCVRDIRKSWRKKNNSSPVRLPCTW